MPSNNVSSRSVINRLLCLDRCANAPRRLCSQSSFLSGKHLLDSELCHHQPRENFAVWSLAQLRSTECSCPFNFKSVSYFFVYEGNGLVSVKKTVSRIAKFRDYEVSVYKNGGAFSGSLFQNDHFYFGLLTVTGVRQQ